MRALTKWDSNYINNNNNPICKALKALASGQSWVLLKSLTEEVREGAFDYGPREGDGNT